MRAAAAVRVAACDGRLTDLDGCSLELHGQLPVFPPHCTAGPLPLLCFWFLLRLLMETDLVSFFLYWVPPKLHLLLPFFLHIPVVTSAHHARVMLLCENQTGCNSHQQVDMCLFARSTTSLLTGVCLAWRPGADHAPPAPGLRLLTW